MCASSAIHNCYSRHTSFAKKRPHTFLRSGHDANVTQRLFSLVGHAHKCSWAAVPLYKAGQCNFGPHNRTHAHTHTSTCLRNLRRKYEKAAQAACTCESRVYCQSQPKPEHQPQLNALPIANSFDDDICFWRTLPACSDTCGMQGRDVVSAQAFDCLLYCSTYCCFGSLPA